MVKVTVVVPIFGVEKYIERCVRSLFEQSLNEIEYIFVDDCTFDKSIDVLNSLINEYSSRLKKEGKTYKLLRQPENKGLPLTRWLGVKEASGDYIVHCDSDDWVDCDMYRLMYEEAIKTQADMVVCDYYVSDGSLCKPQKAFKHGLNRDEIYKKMFDCEIPWMVWNKMIKTDFYRNPGLIVPTNTHGEDMTFILQLLYNMNTISYIERPLYYYLRGSATITHNQDIDSILKRFNAVVENVKIIERFFTNKEKNGIITNGLICLKLVNRNKLISLISDDYYYNIWINTFPEINDKIYGNPNILLKHKVKYFLAKNRLLKFKK